jgi:hypothetical protein
VDPTVGVDAVVKEKMPALPGNQIPVFQLSQSLLTQMSQHLMYAAYVESISVLDDIESAAQERAIVVTAEG